ncbi:hypothetical protein OsccyDRAFT_0217 [Leptolyngbyaceae cyanobacterium JSC-12]|nr:hypothetical protein OsccyDRAFT_0217 [Leptolyngbyaceae cyanobacterium JSC-12]
MNFLCQSILVSIHSENNWNLPPKQVLVKILLTYLQYFCHKGCAALSLALIILQEHTDIPAVCLLLK